MEIKNTDDCFRFRLLRKVPVDMEKSKKSIEMSRKMLEDAKNLYKISEKHKIFHFVIVDSYMAMFHAARSLLYRDGIQEKSHFAIYVYLREKYSSRIPIPIINLLNIYRAERHEVLYGFEHSSSKEDAAQSISDAESFVKEIEKVLGNL